MAGDWLNINSEKILTLKYHINKLKPYVYTTASKPYTI